MRRLVRLALGLRYWWFDSEACGEVRREGRYDSAHGMDEDPEAGNDWERLAGVMLETTLMGTDVSKSFPNPGKGNFSANAY